MSDEIKNVIVTTITVGGFKLYTSGAVDQQYPDSPFSLDIGFSDFNDPEDAKTVWRLLSQAAKNSINKL